MSVGVTVIVTQWCDVDLYIQQYSTYCVCKSAHRFLYNLFFLNMR